jgi:hypothetical protein
VPQVDPIVAAVLEALNSSRSVLTGRLLKEPIPPPRFLWESMIIAGEVTTFTGGWGSGKSKLLCGLAVSVAAGLGSFLGQPCESGCVVIISGEDGVQFYRRSIKAWCNFLGVDIAQVQSRIAVYYLPDLMVEGQSPTVTIHARGGLVTNVPLVDALIRSLSQEGALYYTHAEQMDGDETIPSYGSHPLRLVIAETASTLSVGDESNESMRELIRALAAISHRVSSLPAVVVTHHTTKAAFIAKKALGLGASRGGGSFEANARGALTIGAEAENSPIQVLRCQRLRDGLPGPPIELVFRPVEVDGFQTAVLAPAPNTPGAIVREALPAAQLSPPEGANGSGRGKGAGRPSLGRPGARTASTLAIASVITEYAEHGEPLTKAEVLAHPLVTAAGLGRDSLRELLDALITSEGVVAGPSRQGTKFTLVPGARLAEITRLAEMKLAEKVDG